MAWDYYDFHEGRGYTRAEFEGLVTACAAQLRERVPALRARQQGDAGAREAAMREAGPRVAALSRNSVRLLALMAACFRTGAVFVSLNWRLSPHELEALLDDCDPSLLYVQGEFRPQVAATRVPCLDPDAGFGEGRFEGRDAPDAQLGMLLYTSGTSGKPKGVMLTLGNLRAGSRNFRAVADIRPESVLLCDAPMFHTIGLVAISHTALMTGARVLFSPAFKPDDTIARIGDPALGITHYFTVPQVAQMLLHAPAFAPQKFERLRGLFTGGAPLSQELVLEWRGHGVQIVNGYGSSEASTAIHLPLDPTAHLAGKVGSIGLPAPEIEVSLHDHDGHQVAEGEVGEIWLRGPSLTQGYWGKPEERANCFTDGWFRTGDAARRDADGCYYIVDRWKDMYISGGENVYPAEVEAVIARLPAVLEAAVVGQPDAQWGEVGEAFVVLRPGAALGADELGRYLRAELAGYKCPKQVTFVAALPRTASGKVQKTQLRRKA